MWIRINGVLYSDCTKKAVHTNRGGPSVMREPVEALAGETSATVCGGKSLNSTVRNFVVTFPDERAVHKGTGT